MTPTLEHIWNDFSEQLARFVQSRVSDPATAEDILQDVFVKIHQRLGQLQDPAKLQSWIYLIARNAIVDHYRRQRKTVEMSESIPGEEIEESPETEGLKKSIRRMIDTLAEPYRSAVILTDLEGLTQRELAQRLGISVSGVKSRVQRGRAQLKKLLHECCAFEFDRRGNIIECRPQTGGGCIECERRA